MPSTFAPRDARALEREKAKSDEDKAVVRLGQARENLAQAQRNLGNEDARINAMRGAGIVVTDAEADHIIETAQAQVDHWDAEVDRLTPSAFRSDARRIRPRFARSMRFSCR